MFGSRGRGYGNSRRGWSSNHNHHATTPILARDHDDMMFEAQERKRLAALKFDEWVRFKDRFDRGLELFAKLDSSHCQVCIFRPPLASTQNATFGHDDGLALVR